MNTQDLVKPAITVLIVKLIMDALQPFTIPINTFITSMLLKLVEFGSPYYSTLFFISILLLIYKQIGNNDDRKTL